MADTAVSTGALTQYPSLSDAEDSVTQSGFKITTRKMPILKAGPIEDMTQKLGIAPPEMIFGDNFVRIEHLSSGWKIDFSAYDALDRVDKTGNSMLQVAYSKEWQRNRYSSCFLWIRPTTSLCLTPC